MVVTLSVSKIPALLSILYRLAFTDLCRIERGSEQRICSLGVLPGGSKEIQDNLRGPSRRDSCMLRDEPAVLMPPETYSNKQFLRLHPLTPIRHCGVYVSNFQTMIFCSRKCGRINSLLVEREVRPAFVKFCI